MESLADRVRFLVDRHHEGNVLAAATDIGVTQQTLDRIVRGVVKSPRAEALQAIARFYRTSVDWLLSGGGEAPGERPGDPKGAAELRWRAVLDRLELPPILRDVLAGLPGAASQAVARMDVHDFAEQHGADYTQIWREIDAVTALEYRTWTAFLLTLVAHFGPEATRDLLARNIPTILTRFADRAPGTAPLSDLQLANIEAERQLLPTYTARPGFDLAEEIMLTHFDPLPLGERSKGFWRRVAEERKREKARMAQWRQAAAARASAADDAAGTADANGGPRASFDGRTPAERRAAHDAHRAQERAWIHQRHLDRLANGMTLDDIRAANEVESDAWLALQVAEEQFEEEAETRRVGHQMPDSEMDWYWARSAELVEPAREALERAKNYRGERPASGEPPVPSAG